MSTPRGLLSTGFVGATITDVLAEVEADELADIDTDLDVDPDEAIGQLNGIYSKKTAELWELAQTVNDAFDDENAEGAQLDALAAITGTYRHGDEKGTVKVTCALVGGTTLPTTARVSDPAQPTNRWLLETEYTAASSGNYALPFRAENIGPIPALAGNLSKIDTPISGWIGAVNTLDAAPGTLYEQDPELRIRRRLEIAGAGRGNVPAMVADLIKVHGVVSAFLVENLTNVYDSDGRPPHSVEAFVFDGVTPLASDDALRLAVFTNSTPGIDTRGTNSGMLTDAYGAPHIVRFSRLVQVPVTIVYHVRVDKNFPIDGVARIKAATVALQARQTRGASVIFIRTEAAPLSIPGVVDILLCTQAAPGHSADGTNILVDRRSIAVYDTSRVTVATVGP